MNWIEVEKGVRLFVQDINPRGKRTVFLIHGWPVNHRMFEYQLDVLPKYGFRCVAVDLRGFGNSSMPWGGYGYDRMAEDIHTVIREMKLNQIILAGFSMGGAIAIRYMARYAGYKVEKLALLAAAAPSFVQRPGFPYGQLPETVDSIIELAYKDRPQMVTEFGEMFFASEVTPSFRTWFQSLGFDASGHGTIQTAVTLREEDLRQDLGKIRVPTGIFHGKQDKLCPFALAEAMKQGIPNSVLYPFENSGHAIFYDELERFNGELIHFMEK